MKIIALTGGVASGKNFIASIFAANFDCEIFDADEQVHSLLKNDQELINEISKNFPNAIVDNKIDRKKLGSEVFHDTTKLEILESIIHPKVKKSYDQVLTGAKQKNVDFLILNIPLLIEKGNYHYDSLIAITTDINIRQERYLRREVAKDYSQDELELVKKFKSIVANQASDEKRISIAHFVLDGGMEERELVEEVKRIVGNL